MASTTCVASSPDSGRGRADVARATLAAGSTGTSSTGAGAGTLAASVLALGARFGLEVECRATLTLEDVAL
jgi:hypothetical protein